MRQYLIIQTRDLDKIDFSQVLETSQDTVRKSVDETKTFVKWDDNIHNFIINLTGTEGPYTHEEILKIMNTKEWSSYDTSSIE